MKNAANNGAKSFAEISKETKIKYNRIMYILEKHPVVKERLLQAFEENKKVSVPKVKRKISKKVIEPVLPEAEKYIIIDASICGAKGALQAIHREISESNAKIILTDITVEELTKLEDGDDNTAYVARRILSNSAKHTDTYYFIKITKTSIIDDKSIVDFASTVKNAVLFTADKGMNAIAKLEKVEVNFFIKSNKPFYGIIYKDEKPVLKAGLDNNNFIIIRHKDSLLYEGEHCLYNGDEIFSLRKTDDEKGVKLLCFKVKIHPNNSFETHLVDRSFIRGNYVNYKYKNVYSIFKQFSNN